MATIFNSQRVLGVRLQTDGATLFNNQPVRGVRAAANGVTFDGGWRVLGVDVLDADAPIHNDQPVIGVVVISDGRTIYNGREVLPAWAVTGDLGGGGGAGSITAAAIEPDGWTLRVDLADIGTGTVDHTKVSGSVTPPATDYLGVSMAGVGARAIAGAASNLNIRYDADVPFPSPQVSGSDLTVWVRLDKPVRAGESVNVTIAAGLVPGALAGSLTATNNSVLRSSRYAQDQFGVDSSKLIAMIDFQPGCRSTSLLPVASLPTSFSSGAYGGKYDHCRYDVAGKRVFVGNGAGDLTNPVLADVDFTGTPDVYITFNSPNAKARDVKFGCKSMTYFVAFGTGIANSTAKLQWFEQAGEAKGIVTGFGAMTGTWAAYIQNHNVSITVTMDAGYGYIHGTCSDVHHIAKGDAHHCLIEDVGWDNRAAQLHMDGLIGIPNYGAVRSFGNFVDLRANGGVAYASSASISGTTVTLTLTGTSPTDGFAVGFYASVIGLTQAGYIGQKLITAIDAGAKTISYSVASNVGTPTISGACVISVRSISGYYGLDNPATVVYASMASVNDQKADSFEAFNDFVIANEVSFTATNSYARGGTGDSTANPSPDNRYVRGVNVHDCWMTKPGAQTSPLYQQDKAKPYTIWPPDAKWSGNKNPADNTTWTIGPQPADTEYYMTVDSPTHAAGDTIVFTLRVDFYLAQYGAETITVSASGSGFANSLDTDMAAAIASISGLSYSAGVLTMSPGLTGNRKGQSNQGLYITINRLTTGSASGVHSLTLSANSAGTIVTPSASTTI